MKFVAMVKGRARVLKSTETNEEVKGSVALVVIDFRKQKDAFTQGRGR